MGVCKKRIWMADGGWEFFPAGKKKQRTVIMINDKCIHTDGGNENKNENKMKEMKKIA